MGRSVDRDTNLCDAQNKHTHGRTISLHTVLFIPRRHHITYIILEISEWYETDNDTDNGALSIDININPSLLSRYTALARCFVGDSCDCRLLAMVVTWLRWIENPFVVLEYESRRVCSALCRFVGYVGSVAGAVCSITSGTCARLVERSHDLNRCISFVSVPVLLG